MGLNYLATVQNEELRIMFYNVKQVRSQRRSQDNGQTGQSVFRTHVMTDSLTGNPGQHVILGAEAGAITV